MGYCFDYRGRLVCDGCSISGGVRKRKCPHKVKASILDGGNTMPYCRPPALCAGCYKHHGGLRGVHGDRCRDGAAESQASYDADNARLAKGDLKSSGAFGDWSDLVPKGKVGLLFYGLDGAFFGVLLDNADYDNRAVWFLDLESYEPWPAGELRFGRKAA